MLEKNSWSWWLSFLFFSTLAAPADYLCLLKKERERQCMCNEQSVSGIKH